MFYGQLRGIYYSYLKEIKDFFGLFLTYLFFI